MQYIFYCHIRQGEGTAKQSRDLSQVMNNTSTSAPPPSHLKHCGSYSFSANYFFKICNVIKENDPKAVFITRLKKEVGTALILTVFYP